MNKKQTINRLGVFDSGVGGLTVLNELITLSIPEIIYFGDTLNLPYGQKTAPHIKQLSLAAVNFLLTQKVDAIVIACHTASAIAFEHIISQHPTLFLTGVVQCVINDAIAATKNKKIGVIGTQATIASDVHRKKILEAAPECSVFTQACPALVPLIETGHPNKKQLRDALEMYLTPLLNEGCDSIIIGCTHYELIKEEIYSFTGPEVALISAPHGCTQEIKRKIITSSTEDTTSPSSLSYFVSGDPQAFKNNAFELMKLTIEPVQSKYPDVLTLHQEYR